MKSVMISIQPRWCELIASGKKTVEVRKTRPKIEPPFKVYIYRTKGFVRHLCNGEWWNMPVGGEVIGEFVCDCVEEMGFSSYNHGEYICKEQSYIEQSCLTFEEMFDYLGERYGHGWHISDLVIYGEPKELSEFFMYCGENPKCEGCEAHYYSNTESGCEDYCCSVIDGHRPLKRPPQSWCYVVEKVGTDE